MSKYQAEANGFNLDRMPPELQVALKPLYETGVAREQYLALNTVHQGDARQLLDEIAPNSVALSVWSPPYFVGKSYEADLSFPDWQSLLKTVIRKHFPVIAPGGFLAVNIADILVFHDEMMPRIQADVVNRKKSSVTKEDVLAAMEQYPDYNRYQLAKLLGCSEQTIDRRLHGNNIRGGKSETQTRVKIVGGMLEEWALAAGFYPYDRRVWVKDAAWENSRWASLTYRSVDEFEYVYIFWKPGVTVVNRDRLSKAEWSDWGSRGVWTISSVRSNDDHESKFPVELPTRVMRLLTEPGDTVLDCFMGSGTTALAALDTDRQFIGIELRSSSVALANNNIANHQRRLLEKRNGYADGSNGSGE